jgi:hypothetical protein
VWLSLEAKRDFSKGLENMPKKSRKRATRYSELSKSKKKQRQGARPAPEPKPVSAATTEEAPAPTATAAKKSPIPAKSPAPQKGPKTQPGIRLAIPDYRYVRDDLKRVGILTGAVIVIIIILAFVLG